MGERAVVAIAVEADDVEPVAGGVARVEDGDAEDLDAAVLRRRGFFEERGVAVERDDGEVGVQPGAVGAGPDARGRPPLLVRPLRRELEVLVRIALLADVDLEVHRERELRLVGLGVDDGVSGRAVVRLARRLHRLGRGVVAERVRAAHARVDDRHLQPAAVG